MTQATQGAACVASHSWLVPSDANGRLSGHKSATVPGGLSDVLDSTLHLLLYGDNMRTLIYGADDSLEVEKVFINAGITD